jgi:hypothetical protein
VKAKIPFALAYQLCYETGIFERVLASLSKRRRVGQGKKKFGLHVCLMLQVFGFQVDHLFLIFFFVEIVHFQHCFFYKHGF